MNNDRMQPWKVLKDEVVYDGHPWIKLSVQQVALPDGRVVDDYHQIELPDYCLIYAENDDGNILVERQYKHGFRRVSLTLPAGSIEDGEDPLQAAKRELLEETGSVSENWQSLGVFITHGNYRCSVAHLFHAKQTRQIVEPDSGDLEDMEIFLMKPSELLSSLCSGEIVSMSSVTAILLAENNHRITPDSKEMAF